MVTGMILSFSGEQWDGEQWDGYDFITFCDYVHLTAMAQAAASSPTAVPARRAACQVRLLKL
jgi:hypothetical protein